jgi:hypothetical protein
MSPAPKRTSAALLALATALGLGAASCADKEARVIVENQDVDEGENIYVDIEGGDTEVVVTPTEDET